MACCGGRGTGNKGRFVVMLRVSEEVGAGTGTGAGSGGAKEIQSRRRERANRASMMQQRCSQGQLMWLFRACAGGRGESQGAVV